MPLKPIDVCDVAVFVVITRWFVQELIYFSFIAKFINGGCVSGVYCPVEYLHQKQTCKRLSSVIKSQCRGKI